MIQNVLMQYATCTIQIEDGPSAGNYSFLIINTNPSQRLEKISCSHDNKNQLIFRGIKNSLKNSNFQTPKDAELGNYLKAFNVSFEFNKRGLKELLNKIESGKIRAISRYNYNDSHDNVVNNFMVFKHLLYDSTVSKQQQKKRKSNDQASITSIASENKKTIGDRFHKATKKKKITRVDTERHDYGAYNEKSQGVYSFNNDIHGSPALSNSQSLDLFIRSQPQGPENYPNMQSQLTRGNSLSQTQLFRKSSMSQSQIFVNSMEYATSSPLPLQAFNSQEAKPDSQSLGFVSMNDEDLPTRTLSQRVVLDAIRNSGSTTGVTLANGADVIRTLSEDSTSHCPTSLLPVFLEKKESVL